MKQTLKPIQETARRIKQLEVQGARNVAVAAIKAMDTLAKGTKAKSKKEFFKELFEARTILFSSRETEPLMRNAVRWIMSQVEKNVHEKVVELAEIVTSASEQFLMGLESSKEKIAEIGARRISNKAAVLTHCHSSTVTHSLRRAKLEGKAFEVICTESRPVFQGRITAKEMLELGVKTTLIVDSAARSFMNQVDLVLVGADAITSEGNVVNKIGTSMIALIAKESRTPFYVVSELLKFDPVTKYGSYERIEERSPNEIWNRPPKNLNIRNPAFDITRRDFVHGIICEEGVIPPHSIMQVIHRKYPWVLQ